MGLFDLLIPGGGGGELAEAKQLWDEINVPDSEKAIAELKQIEALNPYVAEQMAAELAPGSSLSTYKGDPRLKEAQMRALAELEAIGSGGGLRASDRARINDIRRQTATADRGAREAIMQNAAARGVGGSGMELASKLISQQASADREAAANDDVAARAEDRALQAIMGSGKLGGEVRSQGFDEARHRASAEDAINTFNARNKNLVGQWNAENRQNASNSNIAQKYGNFGTATNLRQNEFGNKVTKTRGQTGALGDQADYEARESDRIRKGLGGMADWAGGYIGF